jgi:adenylate kinase family enzyme
MPLVNRVLIVGPTGSGKTTVAARLAAVLGARFVDLDALFWKPNWTRSDPDEFRTRVAGSTSGGRWVADGDYLPQLGDLLWERADTVVWLDPALALMVARLVRRTTSRSLHRTKLWAGNREHLSNLFNKEPSLVAWARDIQTERRAVYSARMSDPAWSHLSFVPLRSRREVRRWLSEVGR